MMPLLMMNGIDVHITNSPESFEGFDAIYYNRFIDGDLINTAKQAGCKVIIDVDDYWHLDAHHIASDVYKEYSVPELQIQHIEQADLITTTHERLQAKIKPYNERCVITANAIPKHEYFLTARTESILPRIFWQGSITHERDIALLKNPFKRLTGCGAIIAGYTKHDVWGKMVNAFTDGLRLPGLVLPGLPPHEYYSNYKFADICVAPLLGGMFNSMKSNLKVLEAAHSGLPIVCSKVDPYLDLPVLYADKQSDWFKVLNYLIRDKEAREHHGKALADYCNEYYNFEKINEFRKQQFEELIYEPNNRTTELYGSEQVAL